MNTQGIFRDTAEYVLLLSAALYGSTFMLITIAVETLSPMTIVAGRQVLAAAIFNVQTNYAIPIMAIFWAWLILGEIPEPVVYAALALILLSIATVRGLPQVKLFRRKMVL